MRRKPRCVLLILDGLGIPRDPERSAVSAKTMSRLHRLMDTHGVATLAAAEEAVGLQAGQPGNSEAGHLTIGAGHRIPAKICAIHEAFASDAWAEHPIWSELNARRRLHIVGLISDAGVHGHLNTFVQAATLASRLLRETQVFCHAILDGVDSAAGSAAELLQQVDGELQSLASVELATVMGRRWATDRSGDLGLTTTYVDSTAGRLDLPVFSWDALEAHLCTKGSEASFPGHVVCADGYVGNSDAVLLTNHRADRTAQLAQVYCRSQAVYSMVDLGGHVPVQRVFFPTEPVELGLVQELGRQDISVIRVAEQCKFPHVTFFLNGFRDTYGEEAICVPTIADDRIVREPQMSIEELTGAILRVLERDDARVLVANIANLDQVGHTGKMEAAKSAAAHVDRSLAVVAERCQRQDWALFVTGDHGNAEVMIDVDGRPWASHTQGDVPFVAVPSQSAPLRLVSQVGSLANVAPSMMASLGLGIPGWMSPSLVAV